LQHWQIQNLHKFRGGENRPILRINKLSFKTKIAKVTEGVAEGSLNESDKFTSWYDWKDQAKSSGYTITKKDDKIVALNKQGQVVGHWSDVGKFLSGKTPRPNFKRPEE
jgi:hypothetical protein